MMYLGSPEPLVMPISFSVALICIDLYGLILNSLTFVPIVLVAS